MKTRYWSRTGILTALVLTASAGFASCDKEKTGPDPEPPVELKDQIEYNGGTPLNIMSAIYEVTDGNSYTFYLSPTAGITGMDAMKEADDYLLVSVKDPKGTVDTETEDFTVSFGDIKADKTTMSTDVKELKLSADFVAETGILNLHVELAMQSGKTLLAKYNNKCTEAEPAQLDNQYELDKVISSIGSALVSKNPAEGMATYILYKEGDVAEESTEALEIKVADDVDTKKIDLATADAAKVSVTCGAFKNETGTTGSLSIVISTGSNTLTVNLDAENGNNTLRANYKGSYAIDYESGDYINVTPASGEPVDAALEKVFRYNGANTQKVFMLGTVETAETPADLANNGGYALKVKITEANLGKTLKIEDKQLGFILYDYNSYRTYDNSDASGENVTGTVTTTVDGDKVYISFSAKYPDGLAVKGEWYGTVTAATEDTDLTPVEPFRPSIVIKSETGETKLDKTISSVEVRLEKGYRLRGGEENGGATIDAYFFYFRPEGITDEIDGSFSYSSIPEFMIPASYIGQAKIPLGTSPEGLEWTLRYGGEGSLQAGSTGYSNTYTSYGMTGGYCPADAVATVIQNENKTWDIAISLTDKYMSYGFESGSKNKLSIQWKGKATKYSGSKTNDLTDSDY